MSDDDTIFALSSGPPPTGVAVVRISGPAIRFGLGTLIRTLPKPGMHTLTKLYLSDGSVLDEAIVLFFQGPQSFTGEDVVELQTHGSAAVLQRLLEELASIETFRSAEAGEFTRRAFLNGRLDLTAAEGLADLIDAQTDIQRRQALRQSTGALNAVFEDWRVRLIDLRALLEAELDFSDEDDVDTLSVSHVDQGLNQMAEELSASLTDSHRGERIRSGIDIVLNGAVNAGKSSLLNVLAKRDAAIVTAEAGTTRDLVTVSLDLGGFPVIVTDTAGLRKTDGAVEKEGIRRANQKARSADLVLWLVDGTAPVWPDKEFMNRLNCPIWTIQTKGDLNSLKLNASVDHLVSVSKLSGITALMAALVDFVGSNYGLADSPFLTNARQRELLAGCLREVQAAQEQALFEIKAEHLRRGTDQIGRIVGRIDHEDVLDAVFSRFCIGK